MKVCLKDIANVIRSKNAGPFELTLDVLLKDQQMFEKLRQADVINTKVIAQLYQIPETDVISIVYFPNARAIKATIVRPLPSGALGERDVYGAQQHAPLVNFTFEVLKCRSNLRFGGFFAACCKCFAGGVLSIGGISQLKSRTV